MHLQKVVGGAHLCAFGVPAELVLRGVPVGDGGDGGAAEDGGPAVVEGDTVVGEPGAEGAAAAFGDCCGELAFELEEFENAGREVRRGHGDEDVGRWRCRSGGCGRRCALGVHARGCDDGGGAEQKGGCSYALHERA